MDFLNEIMIRLGIEKILIWLSKNERLYNWIPDNRIKRIALAFLIALSILGIHILINH